MCICIWFDYVRCVLYVFVFDFTFANFAIIQIHIRGFLCIHVCICSPEEVLKTLPLSWPRPSFWLRCSSRCRTSHPSERRGGWRQCHQHHHHQWPSSSLTSLFHFHLSAISISVGSDFREIVVMRSDSGKKWCLHHNRWVSEKQHNLRAENN